MDGDPLPLPLGRSGRTEVLPLANSAGDHALLVRQSDVPRLLLTAEAVVADPAGRELVVVMPLDDDIETRVDGDVLAVWVAVGSRSGATVGRPPGWASALGFLMVIALVILVVVGSAAMFGWLLDVISAGG